MNVAKARKLRIADIADIRAYERERVDFRGLVIALKQRRRVSVGPYITFVFENRDTIRFQIQEMARVEKLYSDEQIETELNIYNPLIPEAGHVAATMFIELTSEALLREWLPKLVGVERTIALRFGDERVAFTLDAAHEAQLTRDDITSAVHYVHLALDPDQIDKFATGTPLLVVEHPAYSHETTLGSDTIAELLGDLRED